MLCLPDGRKGEAMMLSAWEGESGLYSFLEEKWLSALDEGDRTMLKNGQFLEFLTQADPWNGRAFLRQLRAYSEIREAIHYAKHPDEYEQDKEVFAAIDRGEG